MKGRNSKIGRTQANVPRHIGLSIRLKTPTGTRGRVPLVCHPSTAATSMSLYCNHLFSHTFWIIYISDYKSVSVHQHFPCSSPHTATGCSLLRRSDEFYVSCLIGINRGRNGQLLMATMDKQNTKRTGSKCSTEKRQ